MRGSRRVAVGAMLLAIGLTRAEDAVIPKYDLQRTGFTQQKLSPPLALAWKYSTSADKSLSAMPVVVGNRVFLCSHGTLLALDIETGTQVWEPYATGYEIRMTPVYFDGKLLVGNEKGEISILDTADTPAGARVIKYIPSFGGGALRSDPVIIGTTMYLLTDLGNLYAFDLKTLDEAALKTPIWRFGQGPRGPLCLAGDCLAFSGQDFQVYCYNIARKRLVWRIPAGVVTSHVSYHDGLIYVGSSTDVRAMKVTTGTDIWRSKARGFKSSPSFALGNIYVAGRDIGAGNNDYIYQLDPAKGTVKNSQLLDSPAQGPPIIAGTDLYCGTALGNIYCLDAATLSVKWCYRVNPVQTVGPAAVKNGGISVQLVVANDNLFALNDQGTLFCFKPDAIDIGKPQLVSPQFVTNDIAGGLTAFALVDDALKKKIIDRAEADAAALHTTPPAKPVLPPEVADLKLPCRQKYFRLQTYVYDEGSGISLETIHVEVDGQPWPSELLYINRKDVLLVIDLVDPKGGLGRRNLPDGTHVISIAVPDYKDNLVKKTFSVTVDNTLAAIPKKVVTPAPGTGTGTPGNN